MVTVNSPGQIVVITKAIFSLVSVTVTDHGKTNNNHTLDGIKMIKSTVGVYIHGKAINNIKGIFNMASGVDMESYIQIYREHRCS